MPEDKDQRALGHGEFGRQAVIGDQIKLCRRNLGPAVRIDHRLRRDKHLCGKRGFAGRSALASGDAERLPLRDARFDGALIAFGIRNVGEPVTALREIHRVLRPGGRLVVLEFSMPGGPLGAAYRVYFERLLPRIAGLVSGDRAAYSYLPASVARFPDPAAFGRLMEEAGFTRVSWTRLTAGIAHLHRGDKGTG